MPSLKTAGDLRGFLTEVLEGIRSGSIDTNKANSIAKVCAQINESLKVEVETAIQLKKLGGPDTLAGSMVIATHDPEVEPATDPAKLPRPAGSLLPLPAHSEMERRFAPEARQP